MLFKLGERDAQCRALAEEGCSSVVKTVWESLFGSDRPSNTWDKVKVIDDLFMMARDADSSLVQIPSNESAPMVNQLLGLLAGGKIRHAEMAVRVFGWSGVFGAELRRDASEVNRGHGADGRAVYAALVRWFMLAARLATDRQAFGTAAALYAHALREAPALDVCIDEKEVTERMRECIDEARKRGQAVALDLRDFWYVSHEKWDDRSIYPQDGEESLPSR